MQEELESAERAVEKSKAESRTLRALRTSDEAGRMVDELQCLRDGSEKAKKELEEKEEELRAAQV